MAKIVQKIDIVNQFVSTTSTTYTPTDGSLGMVEVDLSKYDGTVSAYYEIVGKSTFSGIPDAIGYMKSQLYDATNSQAVTNSELTTFGNYNRKRDTDNIASYFSSARVIYPQYRVTAALTAAYFRSARLVIYQEGTITKTVSHIPIGDSETFTNTAYAEIAYPKRWVYTSTDYNGTVAVYFAATLDGSLCDYPGAYAELWDITANAVIAGSEIITDQAYTFVKSGNIAAALTSGHELTVKIKTSGVANTGMIANAFLIIEQTNIPTDGTGKFKTVAQMTDNEDYIVGTSYSPGLNPTQYNPSDWSNCTVTSSFEAVMKSSNAAYTAYDHITDDGVEISGSEITTTSTSYLRVTSGTLTNPGAASEIDTGFKSSSALGRCTSSSGRMIIAVTALTYAATNIVDTIGRGVIPFAR